MLLKALYFIESNHKKIKKFRMWTLMQPNLKNKKQRKHYECIPQEITPSKKTAV